MPTIVRKSFPVILETRREILRTIPWHVRSNMWRPPTDVYETEENFVVRAEIAGMRDNDFEVALDNNILIISGSRPDLNERRAYHQMEIWFGKFEIAVEIPVLINVDNSVAEYKDGFLMVNLPKAKPKQDMVEK